MKHVPESNGRVGIIGISYDGYEPLVALVNPHPALKVSVPMNPMVDGWRGDDWFHNGAFRQLGMDYIFEQEATRDNSLPFAWNSYDLYDTFLAAGSAGELGRQHGMDQVGFWRQITQHPAYDSFWQSQAMDRILAGQPLKVPVMLVDSLWDAEDIYGAPAVYRALEPKDSGNDMVYLSLGPWYHGQGIDQGRNTGAIQWDQDASKWWRHQVLAPFLAHYLKGTPMDVAPVTAFHVGRQPVAAVQELACRTGVAAPVPQARDDARLRARVRSAADRRLLVGSVASRHLRAAAGAGVEL